MESVDDLEDPTYLAISNRQIDREFYSAAELGEDELILVRDEEVLDPGLMEDHYEAASSDGATLYVHEDSEFDAGDPFSYGSSLEEIVENYSTPRKDPFNENGILDEENTPYPF